MMQSFTRRNLLRMAAAASVTPIFQTLAQEAGSAKPLGVALLGLGDYSTKQLGPALKLTKQARLVGIVTGSPEKVPVWKKEYGIADANVYDYENFDRIVDNPDIDIVYVVTPTGLHAEFAIRAAKAGKHVICEKPMAPTVEDCTRMIEAAKAAGVMLQIGYRLHWDPYHQRMMELMEKETYGKWESISAAHAGMMRSFTGLNAWRISRNLGVAGALYDLGVYAVQGALYTAGSNPVSVTAKHSTARPEIFSEVPETYEWTLEFADGRKAAGMSSYGQSGNYLRAEMAKGRVAIEPAFGYGGQKGETPDGPLQFPVVNQQSLQIDGQVAAILGKSPSRVPGEMGRRDIQVIRGIMKAADTGKPFVFGKFDE
ncbi:MAG: hypothetical protein RLZZ245_84 [Verrucomicrobiota bacterium]